MGAHALLSPSSASRWLNCTAAPHLEADMPDVSSGFAVEGTLAHAYCAKKLKTFLGLPTEHEDKEIAELADYHTGEMDEYTDAYAAIVIEKYNAARAITPDAQLLVETRLDFSEHIPDSFGTADAIIIADGTMDVIDFKYGKGVSVSAFKNPQMQIYALGAYDKFSFEYRIDRVRMTPTSWPGPTKSSPHEPKRHSAVKARRSPASGAASAKSSHAAVHLPIRA